MLDQDRYRYIPKQSLAANHDAASALSVAWTLQNRELLDMSQLVYALELSAIYRQTLLKT